MAPNDSEFYRECPEQKKLKKGGKKKLWAWWGRDLMITIKLDQLIELRVVSIDSECYRECPEQNKIEKGGQKNSCYGRDQGVI